MYKWKVKAVVFIGVRYGVLHSVVPVRHGSSSLPGVTVRLSNKGSEA